MANRTEHGHTVVSVNIRLVLSVACPGGILLVIGVLLGIVCFVRYLQRQRLRSGFETSRHQLALEQGGIPEVDSFRDKRQRDREFPYINYSIKYLRDTDAAKGWPTQPDAEDIYDVPAGRGKKRPCSPVEDLQVALIDRRNSTKCLRLCADALPEDNSQTYPDGNKSPTRGEDLARSESQPTISSDSIACESIVNMPPESVDIWFDEISSHSVDPQPDFGEIKVPCIRDLHRGAHSKPCPCNRHYTSHSFPLRRRRAVCSLENLIRTWSFQSLVEQWRKYCMDDMPLATE